MRIIIIGAGPGGYETAIEAAHRGIEVTMVTDGPLGGVCLNEGCIPTKTLCHYAGLAEAFSRAEGRGVAGGGLQLRFDGMVARKREVVEQLRSGISRMLKHKLITVIHGRAVFKDAHTVLVGGQEYSGDKVIVATGSVPSSLPIPGADLPGVITSREILELGEVPRRLVVIGGGVIGLEFASIFRSLGSEVTVLEYAPDILPRFDADMAKRLRLALSRRGVTVETSAGVSAVTAGMDGAEQPDGGHLPEGERDSAAADGTLSVHYVRDGKQYSVIADKVLMAVGRRPNVESLNLDAVGVEYSRRGIAVDGNMCSSVPDIYAVGDVVGGMMLAHVAVFQGRRALNHICGMEDDICFDLVPSAVFTIPEAASVGMTEESAKEKGVAFKCLKSMFGANGKAVSMDEPEGMCKLIVSFDGGKLLGAHILGAHSADIIQELTALMNRGVTVDALRDIIHAHPTLSEVISSAVSAG